MQIRERSYFIWQFIHFPFASRFFSVKKGRGALFGLPI